MGFVGKGDYNTVYYCDAKSGKNEKPYFKVSLAVKDAKAIKQDNQTAIEGTLRKVYLEDREWEGKTYKVVRMQITDDPKVLFLITVPVDSAIGRDLINRLINIVDFNYSANQIKITLFETDPDEGFDHGFKGFSVKVGGVKVPIAFKYSDIGHMVRKIEIKKGEFQYDSTEKNDYLLAALAKVLGDINVATAADYREGPKELEATEKADVTLGESVDNPMGESDEFPEDEKPPLPPEPDNVDEKDDLPF